MTCARSFAWRWAGERSGREPWSWPQAVEGVRREAREDFWCRRAAAEAEVARLRAALRPAPIVVEVRLLDMHLPAQAAAAFAEVLGRVRRVSGP